MVNEENWRPPSSSSLGGCNELGEILASTFSRPTTRERELGKKNSPPKSLWKEKDWDYLLPRGVPQDEKKEKKRTYNALANLQSLQFQLDDKHYRTHAERMEHVESSGYGQKHIEAEAKKELGVYA